MEDPVAPDDCYRCGYDLRGIADDQACPECGLLAQRSRRETDELHHTRPNWLKRLSLGVWTILLGLGAFLFGLTFQATLEDEFSSSIRNLSLPASQTYRLQQAFPLVLVAIPFALLVSGCWMLTTREGYPPADNRDRWRRRLLRVASLVPLFGISLTLVAQTGLGWYYESSYLRFSQGAPPQDSAWDRMLSLWYVVAFAPLLTIVLSSPLPVLLFFQLRSLARRARSAHLAEHCAIVGIGAGASVLYAAAFYALNVYAEQLHLGTTWSTSSTSSLLLAVLLSTAAILFMLWSLYLLIRFAIAFRLAARSLHSTWRRDDRSLSADSDL
jgi:hypothetical protein